MNMSRSNRISFAGLAKQNPNFGDLVARTFEVRPFRVGDDWVIEATRANLRRLSRNPISIHPLIPLSGSGIEKAASILPGLVDPSLYEYRPILTGTYEVSEGYGLISEIDRLTARLALMPPTAVEAFLANKLLPALVRKLNVTSVIPISIDAKYQQAALTLAKLSYLLSYFGVHKLERLETMHNSLNGVLPHPFDILNYITPFTRLEPCAFALPLMHYNTVWFFCGNGIFHFPRAACEGIMDEFTCKFTPLSDKTHTFNLGRITGIGPTRIHHLINIFKEAINALMRFSNNPSNFTNSDGNIDPEMQVKFYCASYLLFADQNCMVGTSHSYVKTRFAISILDRLANVKKHMSRDPRREEDIMVYFVSKEFGDEVSHIIKTELNKVDRQLSKQFVQLCKEAYSQFFQSLNEQIPEGQASESDLRRRFRTFRNLQHGPFLKHGGFRSLYLGKKGVIPSQVGDMAFFAMLAFSLKPKTFLQLGNPGVSE